MRERKHRRPGWQRKVHRKLSLYFGADLNDKMIGTGELRSRVLALRPDLATLPKWTCLARFADEIPRQDWRLSPMWRKRLGVTQRRSRPRDPFLSSQAWLSARMIALRTHGGRCQCCGATAADGVQIQVDHIKPRSLFPDLALEQSNLQVLCRDCNLGKSNTDQTDWRRTG